MTKVARELVFQKLTNTVFPKLREQIDPIFRLLTAIVSSILFITGCAQFQPEIGEKPSFLERAQTDGDEDIRVTVAVPSAEEVEQTFKLPLYRQGIQPVWLEIRNNSKYEYTLLPVSMDPDYFSAAEVSWKNHFGYSGSSKKIMDELFLRNQIWTQIAPGETNTGYVYTNLKLGTKMILVRLISDETLKEFYFFIDVPGLKADHSQVDFDALYAQNEIIELDEASLRAALEALPCCTTNKDGTAFGDPLNIVIIGHPDTIWPAFIYRGWDETEIIHTRAVFRTIMSSIFGAQYRYSPISALYVFGRPQDIALQKARKTVDERNHLRLWLSPFQYKGQPVWVGQISRDIGVKLTTKSATLTTHEIDPDVDEARAYLIQDFVHAQAIAKLGFAKGVRETPLEKPRFNLTGSAYWTDGLRVVMILSWDPVPLNQIQFFDWERPSNKNRR